MCIRDRARVEEQGYEKAKDVYAYVSGVPVFPPAIEARLRRPLPAGMVLRPIRMNAFNDEVRTLVDIWNDAWSKNWGAAPVTEAETKHLGESLQLILHPRLIWFLEIDGEAAGFGALLPNLNDAIFDLNGSLLPFGWAKLIWRLKVKGVKRGRVPLMGVKRKFARDPRGALAPFVILDAVSYTHLFAVGGDRPEGYGWREILAAAAQAVGRKPALVRAPAWLLGAAATLSETLGAFGEAPPIFTRGKARELLHADWSVRPSELAPGAPAARFGLGAGFEDAVAWYRQAGWLAA